MKRNQAWFNFIPHDDGGVTIDLFDEIGLWGISAKEFKDDLDELDDGGPIYVNINSPGGSVFDGIAIYSLLAARRERVYVEVYGLAASIASVIALAGSELVMRDGSFFMIHDPWSLTVGDAADHRHTADILEKIGSQIIDIYAQHTALTDDELREAMKAETWYTAKEAVEAGFAKIVKGEKAAAGLKFKMLDRFGNVPDVVRDSFNHIPTVDSRTFTGGDDMNLQATPQAVEPQPEIKDARVDELVAKVDDLTQKLDSIAIRPKIGPKIDDEGAQFFYDALRYASENRGDPSRFLASADAITTADGMGIPVAASEQIMINVNQHSWLRKYGADVRPAPAQSTRFSTVVDSGAAAIISEGGSYTEKADPTLITLSLYKVGGRFSITEEAIDDSFMDHYRAFQKYAGRLIARGENDYFISGSGSSQPKGVDMETASVTAAAYNAITFAELLELDEALGEEWDFSLGEGDSYEGPIYLMTGTTAKYIRSLTDTNSNYYFRDHEDGRLRSMFGRPVVRTSDLGSVGTTSAVAIVLVHPAAYLIGERRPNVTIKVGYDNDTHNVTWDFNVRVGGQAWDTNGVKPLKMAATT